MLFLYRNTLLFRHKTKAGPCYPDGNDGITAITIFKYDKTKSGEANGAIGNLYIVFYGVPGFRYSLKLAAGSAATMKMMGFE